jgi:hypothetical protein
MNLYKLNYPSSFDGSLLSNTDQTAPSLESLEATEFIEIANSLYPHERTWIERRKFYSERIFRPSKRIARTMANSIPFTFPASELPDELLCRVASFLDAPTLINARCVSTKFKLLLSANEAGWPLHCQQLWSQRLHVAPAAKRMVWGTNANGSVLPAREAYLLSCTDAWRNQIADDELCYDQNQGTVWSFRVKEAAGAEWTAFDPWHAGEEPRRMVFLRDGRVCQIADNGELRLPYPDAMNAGGVEVRWRKVQRPLIDGAPHCGTGANVAYIRLRVGGRDVPTYIVRRHRSNWGFLMENCWGIFASFPLPRKTPQAAVAPRNETEISSSLNATINAQRLLSTRRCPARNATTDLEFLSDDSTLVVTSRWQWREAMLYNLGANTLPDGPDVPGL